MPCGGGGNPQTCISQSQADSKVINWMYVKSLPLGLWNWRLQVKSALRHVLILGLL